MNQAQPSDRELRSARPSALGAALLTYVAFIVLLLTWAPFRLRWPPTLQLMLSGTLSDVLLNVVLFVIPGFLYQGAFHGKGHVDDRWCVGAIRFGALFSLLIEVGQLLVVGRYTSPLDLTTNAAGAWLGAVVYRGLKGRLDARLAGRLLLEMPLMGLLYLLTPLLWLDGIGAAGDLGRGLLGACVGLCGGLILAAVWRHRLHRAFPRFRMALVSGLWFLCGALPAALTLSWAWVLAGAMLVVAWVWILTRPETIASPVDSPIERRFEGPTLRRLLPLFGAYLLLLAWWPFHPVADRWSWSLAMAGLGADMPAIPAIARVVEQVGAFSVLGYMIAETRGRRDEPLFHSAGWNLACGSVTALLFEMLRGFHPAYDASVTQVLAASAAGLAGAVIYRAQLEALRRWRTTGGPAEQTSHHRSPPRS